MDFGKLEENEDQNKGGTGLGLSICKQIVERMGGIVKVNSILVKVQNSKYNLTHSASK